MEMHRAGAVLSAHQKQSIMHSSRLLVAEMERLDAMRAELAAQVALNTALLAPIWTIPHALLSQIFIILVSDIPIEERDFGTPTVAHVCHDWRTVAFSTPQLWTSVNIPILPLPIPHEVIETFLSRSYQLPLHVRVDATGWDYLEGSIDEDQNSALALQRVAHLSASRWNRLEIWGDYSVFSLQNELELPLLESVVIVPTTWHELEDGWEQPELPLDFLANAPNLRDVTLDVGYSNVNLPWPAIPRMTLVLREGDAAELERIATYVSRQAEELKTLSIEHNLRSSMIPLAEIPTLEVADDDISVASQLTSVAVTGLGYQVLPTFKAPRLSSLAVKNTYQEHQENGGQGPFASILKMMAHTSLDQTLRYLDLDGVLCYGSRSWTDLTRCLESLRALSELRVAGGDHEDESSAGIVRARLLRWLVRDDAASLARLPNLTHLGLYFGRNSYGVLSQVLQTLIDSRRSAKVVGGVSLKALLRFSTDLGPEYELP